jgi:hypothetical protein
MLYGARRCESSRESERIFPDQRRGQSRSGGGFRENGKRNPSDFRKTAVWPRK